MSDLALSKFFKFDETDLASNRAGKLSPKQKKGLEESEKGADQIFVGAGIFFILIALIISYFVASESVMHLFSATGLQEGDLLTILLGVGLPWLFFGFFAYGAFKMGFSKLDNSVEKVEDTVNFVKVEKQVSTSTSDVSSFRTVQQYELRVGKVAFENVDADLLNLIKQGEIYAFYYTRQTKKILSCEFIAKEK